MFPGLSTFRKHDYETRFPVCSPSGNIARKQCFPVSPLQENMAKKQCFLDCPPSGNLARKKCLLICPPSGNKARNLTIFPGLFTFSKHD
jgi:hypothetical protein